MDKSMTQGLHRGFSLLEVLIAVVIFAIGMLALASLQGSLTRSSSDANLRTTAANIAERTIEDLRTFRNIDSLDASGDPIACGADGALSSYQCIASTADAVQITDGGIAFDVTFDVTDYYYDSAASGFTATEPDGAAVSDFKLIELNVTWGASAGFQQDASGNDVDLGTGEITLSAIISSVSMQAAGRVTTQQEDNDFDPFVNYNPGANPDIVSLSLGQNKFKESLTPEPTVIRDDELVETRFEVITYSQSDNGSLFLRREDFAAVSCECELNVAPDAASDGGRRPTIWAGDEYIEPEFVAKPYGVSANNLQSLLCDTCCQDHHDGGSSSNDPSGDPGAILYDPFRHSEDYWADGDTFAGDHKHYQRDRRGNLSEATTDGDRYVEACKLVRKDGFFRVAQDFRQEGLNTFQYDFLDQVSEVSAYSTYVTDSVSTFVGSMTDGYENSPPTLAPPARTAYAAFPSANDLTKAYTNLPTATGVNSQQLRSRGIYIDYLSDGLRSLITCLNDGGDADSCDAGDSTGPYYYKLDKTGSENVLEIIPFFDVQLTKLNRWTESPPADPVETTNEPLETGNTHSRGWASKVQTSGDAMVSASGHRGNLGLTDTDPVDPDYETFSDSGEIQVIINTENPPDPDGVVVTGLIVTGINGFQASQVDISSNDASCDRTGNGFSCLVPTNASNPWIRVSNYQKRNTNYVACSYEVTLPGTSATDTANNPFTTFDLSAALDTITYQISIEEDSCGG